MTIARDPPPECPKHPGTQMVLVGEKKLEGHESSDVHGVAVWVCPLETLSTSWPEGFRIKFRANPAEQS